VQKIIREIESSGGAAKINGGGGKTKGTGMLLIYHKDLKKLQKALKNYKLISTQLTLGVEGLKIENINDTI
jgi:galactokinase/mevalonate kinase-like predicted kinase